MFSSRKPANEANAKKAIRAAPLNGALRKKRTSISGSKRRSSYGISVANDASETANSVRIVVEVQPSALTLDDRVGERREPEDHEQLADHVDAARVIGARLGHVDRRQQTREQADRHVHEEDEAPADRVDERAAQHRSESDAEAHHRAPDADRLRPLARVVEDVAHDRERDGVEHRAAERLKRARRDQHVEAGRHEAQCRADHEHDQARLEDALAAKAVSHRTAEHQQARERERVRVDDPLQAGERRAQVVVDRRQRHVHDRRVEPDDQQAHAADAKDQPAVVAGGVCACSRS